MTPIQSPSTSRPTSPQRSGTPPESASVQTPTHAQARGSKRSAVQAGLPSSAAPRLAAHPLAPRVNPQALAAISSRARRQHLEQALTLAAAAQHRRPDTAGPRSPGQHGPALAQHSLDEEIQPNVLRSVQEEIPSSAQDELIDAFLAQDKDDFDPQDAVHLPGAAHSAALQRQQEEQILLAALNVPAPLEADPLHHSQLDAPVEFDPLSSPLPEHDFSAKDVASVFGSKYMLNEHQTLMDTLKENSDLGSAQRSRISSFLRYLERQSPSLSFGALRQAREGQQAERPLALEQMVNDAIADDGMHAGIRSALNTACGLKLLAQGRRSALNFSEHKELMQLLQENVALSQQQRSYTSSFLRYLEQQNPPQVFTDLRGETQDNNRPRALEQAVNHAIKNDGIHSGTRAALNDAFGLDLKGPSGRNRW
jgi:hypothetical protein